MASRARLVCRMRLARAVRREHACKVLGGICCAGWQGGPGRTVAAVVLRGVAQGCWAASRARPCASAPCKVHGSAAPEPPCQPAQHSTVYGTTYPDSLPPCCAPALGCRRPGRAGAVSSATEKVSPSVRPATACSSPSPSTHTSVCCAQDSRAGGSSIRAASHVIRWHRGSWDKQPPAIRPRCALLPIVLL